MDSVDQRSVTVLCRLILIYTGIKPNYSSYRCFYSLPNDKFLDMTKLKEFADDRFDVAKIKISLCDRVENTLGEEENAGYRHLLLFPQCFPKPSSLGSFKVGIVWQRLNSLRNDKILDLL